MNKYLLLRDNKQSGPYTVPELAQLGIKAYDLVWLEGKSAAWRYPSEVEELKAFSPAVEEQPFDRFYKRPEPVKEPSPKIAAPVTDYAAYAPKVVEPVEEQAIPAKKVYINFPITPGTANKSVTKPVAETPAKENIPAPTVAPGFAEQTFYKQADEVYASRNTHRLSPPSQSSDRKYVYIAAAACFLLVGLIAMLFINNSIQKQKLNELNSIVKQIETKKANEASTTIAQVKNEQPATAPSTPETSETIINPELLNLAQNDAKPADNNPKTETASLPTAPAPAKTTERKPLNAGDAVFTERPVLRRSDNNPAPAASGNKSEAEESASPENLYKLVSVKPNKYRTGVLGGISNLQLELTNNSKRELQKVAIQIRYLGPEKKVVNTQTVYFENVSPGANTTIDVPKSKRGVSIDYTITDIKS